MVSEIENEAELHKYVWFYRSLIDKSVKSFKKMAWYSTLYSDYIALQLNLC